MDLVHNPQYLGGFEFKEVNICLLNNAVKVEFLVSCVAVLNR